MTQVSPVDLSAEFTRRVTSQPHCNIHLSLRSHLLIAPDFPLRSTNLREYVACAGLNDEAFHFCINIYEKFDGLDRVPDFINLRITGACAGFIDDDTRFVCVVNFPVEEFQGMLPDEANRRSGDLLFEGNGTLMLGHGPDGQFVRFRKLGLFRNGTDRMAPFPRAHNVIRAVIPDLDDEDYTTAREGFITVLLECDELFGERL